MKLQANRFVEIYGESAIGMIIGTQAIGEYPGGLAEVVGLESDPAAPEIVFDVRHPTFGEIGVFDYETVEVIPPAPDQTTVPTPQSEADA